MNLFSSQGNALRSVPWLQDLDEENMDRVCYACNAETFVAGDVIVKKGEVGDKFYVVKKGMVKCIVDHDTPALFLGPQKFFGELALLHDQPRAADVIAVRDTEVLTLNRHAFNVLLGPIHSKIVRNYSSDNNSAPAVNEPKPARRASRAVMNVLAPPILNANKILLKELDRGKVLGEGTFGRVEFVRHPRTQTCWALKIMQKKQIVDSGQTKACMLEKEVMSMLQHPLILRLEATFMDQSLLYMLLEIVPGGELFQLLAGKPDGIVSPYEARFYGACVISAFAYMHSKKVVYRDLKPENLLIDRKGYIKVIDFGFGKVLDEHPYRTFTFCGTPEYFAPEMMMGKGYAFSVDTWGIGILIFEMLYGYTPFADFEENNPRTTMKFIMSKKVEFPADGPKDPVAKDLMKNLLKKKILNRLGCQAESTEAVKKHEWFNAEGFSWEKLDTFELQAPWVPPLAGDDDVIEPDEAYDPVYRPASYSGDQSWCSTW